MNKAGFLFLGAVLSIAGTSAVLAGCGGDTTTSTTSTGAGGSTSTGTGTSSAGGAGATSTSGSTGTGVAATLDCASYCGEVMTNCTGADEQYKTMESCMGVCAAFPAGKLTDTDGDTLGCRIYHGGAPAVSAPDTHCAHAGPTGGDKDVTDTMAGTCGEGCEAFCAIAAKSCATTYKDVPTCMAECKTFKADTTSYSTADTAKNDFGCRMYHLSVAATDAASAATHCPHIVAASAVCTQ